MSGRPYKKPKYYLNVKRFGLICLIWNFGFFVKFLAAIGGKQVFNIEASDNMDLATACIFAMADFFTMVIPFYAVIDNKFVKIFAFKALE
jgi:hypothetical protein